MLCLYDFCVPKATLSYFHILYIKSPAPWTTQHTPRHDQTLLISFLKFSAIKQKRERWRKTHGQVQVTHLINSNIETGIRADANFSISSNPRQNNWKRKQKSYTAWFMCLRRMPNVPCIYSLFLLESPNISTCNQSSSVPISFL